MPAITRQIIPIAECTACRKSIEASVLFDVELGDHLEGDAYIATLKPVGCEVRHDCMPKATRNVG